MYLNTHYEISNSTVLFLINASKLDFISCMVYECRHTAFNGSTHAIIICIEFKNLGDFLNSVFAIYIFSSGLCCSLTTLE